MGGEPGKDPTFLRAVPGREALVTATCRQNVCTAANTHPTAHFCSLLPEGRLDLRAACNAIYCCQPEHYSPLCGSDGIMYYSACFAGCPAGAETGPDGQKVSVVTAHCPALAGTGKHLPSLYDQRCCWAPQIFRGCSCVLEKVSSGLGNATAGKCTSTCQRKPLLLALVFVVIIFTFLSSIPALTATLR